MIETGVFYYSYNKDCGIFSSIFKYKLKKNGNDFFIGFPSSSISRICDTLKKNNINYVVLNKDNNREFFIEDKYKSNNNSYNNYTFDINRLSYLSNRIDNIYNKLNSLINSSDIERILLNIEELL